VVAVSLLHCMGVYNRQGEAIEYEFSPARALCPGRVRLGAFSG
jgi:hypothetical protein